MAKKKVHKSLNECILNKEKKGKPWVVRFEGENFFVWAINGRDAVHRVGEALGFEARPISTADLLSRIQKPKAPAKKVAK